MRIAFATAEYVTESNFDGGLSNYIHRVALSLIKMGHEPIVVVASDHDESFVHMGIEVHRVKISFGFSGKMVFVERLMNIAARRLKLNHLLNLCRIGKAINNKIASIHQKKKIDIVQYTHLGGFSLFKSIRVPSVIRLSSYTPLAWEQGGYDYDSSWNVKQQIFIEKLALQRVGAVFGPSRIIAAVVEKELGIKVEVIESPFIIDIDGIDETVFRQNLENKKYLLYFGALSVLKGVMTIADLLHELLLRNPDLHFTFVGMERARYKGIPIIEYIRSQAGEYCDRIIYLGQLHHEQLYPIIEHATAVVLPSRIDNFPNTCIEAMAHRKVVIGTHGTSFEQLLCDGKSGFLCNIGDSNSLLATIEKVLGLSDCERAEIGNAAYKRIEELRPEKIVKQLVEFYEKSINCHC